MLVKVGSYIGNGQDDRQIINIGFQPDFVIVKGGANGAIYKQNTNLGETSSPLAETSLPITGAIKLFLNDGFSIGTNARVNQQNTEYYYIAIKDSNQDDMLISSYTGNGVNNRTISLPFTPDLVIIKSRTTTAQSVFRTSKHIGDDTGLFSGNLNATGVIKSFVTNGFTLGTSGNVNGNGVTYDVIAFRTNTGILGVGAYQGNSVDRRTILDLPFFPAFVLTKVDNVSTQARLRTKDIHNDPSLRAGAADVGTNEVQGLKNGGFELGSNNSVNITGSSYYYFAFRETRIKQLVINKHYYYKVYDNNEYIATWTKEVISEPSFKTNINGGPGNMTIELGRLFDDFGEDVDVKLNNRVDMYVVDRDNPNGLLLYSGYISGYEPVINEVEEKVIITVLGYVAELQRMILRDSSGNTTLTYNSYDPAAILRDVIDKYRALGGSLRYTDASIDLTNTVISYTFNTNTVKEVLDKIIELCPVGWYFRIDPDGVIHLHPRHITSDHIFTIGLDVERLRTFRRVEDVVNRVFFIGAGSPALFRKYENTGSDDAYGKYEKKIVDQRVSVVATAQTMAEREINSKKDPEIRSTFTILDNNGPGKKGYDIELIKVGETLSVKNLKTAIRTASLWNSAIWDTDVWDQTIAAQAADVIQILSLSYTPDSIVIEASSRLPQIAKRIEDIQRNLEVSQSTNNPAAPS